MVQLYQKKLMAELLLERSLLVLEKSFKGLEKI